jgi:hypothetical protein
MLLGRYDLDAVLAEDAFIVRAVVTVPGEAIQLPDDYDIKEFLYSRPAPNPSYP